MTENQMRRAERSPDSSKGLDLRGMVQSATPKRDHGDPQWSEGKVKLVRAEGLEPSRTLRSNGFSYPATAFAAFAIVWRGLGSGRSLHHARIWLRASGAARLVSTPSRPVSGRAWLGIAISQGSPTLSSSAPPVSRRALKFYRLSPMRLPISPPGTCLQIDTQLGTKPGRRPNN